MIETPWAQGAGMAIRRGRHTHACREIRKAYRPIEMPNLTSDVSQQKDYGYIWLLTVVQLKPGRCDFLGARLAHPLAPQPLPLDLRCNPVGVTRLVQTVEEFYLDEVDEHTQATKSLSIGQIYNCVHIIYIYLNIFIYSYVSLKMGFFYQSFEAGFVPFLNWFGHLARGCTVDMLPTTEGWTSTTGSSATPRNEEILLTPQVSSSITLVLIELQLHVHKSSNLHFIEALAHSLWHDPPLGAGYVESHGHGRQRF